MLPSASSLKMLEDNNSKIRYSLDKMIMFTAVGRFEIVQTKFSSRIA